MRKRPLEGATPARLSSPSIAAQGESSGPRRPEMQAKRTCPCQDGFELCQSQNDQREQYRIQWLSFP
jgi:hypothetical protein